MTLSTIIAGIGTSASAKTIVSISSTILAKKTKKHLLLVIHSNSSGAFSGAFCVVLLGFGVVLFWFGVSGVAVSGIAVCDDINGIILYALDIITR